MTTSEPDGSAGRTAALDGIGVVGLHHVAIADTAVGEVRRALGTLFDIHEGHSEAADGFDEYLLPIGSSCIQTIEANGPGTVQRFLERRGPGLHHIALRVGNVAAALDVLRARGARLIDEQPRSGGDGTTIAFVHPSSTGGVLVELVEDPRD